MIGFVFSLDAAQAAALRASKPMIPPLCWERKEPGSQKQIDEKWNISTCIGGNFAVSASTR